MGQQVLPGGQALQVPHEQANEPTGMGQVYLLLAALLPQPGSGDSLDGQEMAAVDTHFGNLQAQREHLRLAWSAKWQAAGAM